MGHSHYTSPSVRSSRAARRLGRRSCLNKGCGVEFQARRWNQRFCGAPECRREVRRWQAAKRQRRWRQVEKNRQQHAAAEHKRRQRRRETTARLPNNLSADPQSASSDGSAASDGAWSRGKGLPENFCDRPGCFEPVRPTDTVPARYCDDTCRGAVRLVRDRERKWLRRNTYVGRAKRQHEYRRAQRKAAARHQPPLQENRPTGRNSVVDSARSESLRLSYITNKERPP
jgi:hypothetical protein